VARATSPCFEAKTRAGSPWYEKSHERNLEIGQRLAGKLRTHLGGGLHVLDRLGRSVGIDERNRLRSAMRTNAKRTSAVVELNGAEENAADEIGGDARVDV